MKTILVGLLLTVAGACSTAIGQSQKQLKLDVYVASENGWCVTSTLIYGPTEAILVDSEFLKSDANKVADRIAASGRRLKAVVITHPHDDHFLGAATIHQRFPDVPIYLAVNSLERYQKEALGVLDWMKKNMPAEAPDELAVPVALPSAGLSIDGQTVEIRQGRGDDARDMNSFAWIPSLRAIIAGDMVFNHVHAWLADSTAESRAEWIKSLDTLAALHPRIVVGGHKKDSNTADSPDAIDFTRKYLTTFETARASATNADELASAMQQKFPDAALPDKILARTAKKTFAKPKGN